ncbi:Guanine nucleotide-binding protein alpha-2 subunit [Ophidiomyces ophidiicola]|nr:Guanine nucleotide-binding protein alpha-2 subunit [Ophidiomyces ophidiicola]
MGGCLSSGPGPSSGEQKKRSQMIDKKLEEDSKKLRRECSGESGKSTIVKQMKIIHQNGYTVEELSMCRLTVYKNLLECAKSLVTAMYDFDMLPSSPKVRDFMDFLDEYNIDPGPNIPLDPKIGDAVTYLWNDPVVPAVLDRQNEFYLMDSAP